MLPKFMCESMKSVSYFKTICPKKLPEVVKVLFDDYEKQTEKKTTYAEYIESKQDEVKKIVEMIK
jgi:hypothetical protein